MAKRQDKTGRGKQRRRRKGLGTLVGPTRFDAADARRGGAQFYFDVLDQDAPDSAVRGVALDFFAHGFAPDPKRPGCAALLEKRGPGGCFVDLTALEVLQPLELRDGRHFYGHGCFSADGAWLFDAETELATGEGTICVRDGSTLREVDSFPTHGARPHDCMLVDDGATLAITNGGGPADSGQTPCVTFVDVKSQRLLERFEVQRDDVNTGHMAITADGRFAVVSAPREGLSELKHTGIVSVAARGGALRHVTEPADIVERLVGETLSVCIDAETGTVAATNPHGDLVTFWGLERGEYRGSHDLDLPRGVALSRDGRFFVVACGHDARLELVRAATLERVPHPHPARPCFSGSHIYPWTPPA